MTVDVERVQAAVADISTRSPLDSGDVCWTNWGEYSSENQSTTWGA